MAIISIMQSLPDPFSQDFPDPARWGIIRPDEGDQGLARRRSSQHQESNGVSREQKVGLESLRKEPLYWEICQIIRKIATLAIDNPAVLIGEPAQRTFNPEESGLFERVQRWEQSKLLQKQDRFLIIAHQWQMIWKMMNPNNYLRYREWTNLQEQEKHERANRDIRVELMFLKIPLQTPEIWNAISPMQRTLCLLRHSWVWLNVFVIDLHVISVISSAAQNAFSWYLLTAKSFLGWFGVCCGGATFIFCIPFTIAVIWQFPTISNFAVKTFNSLIAEHAHEVKEKVRNVAGSIYDKGYRWISRAPAAPAAPATKSTS